MTKKWLYSVAVGTLLIAGEAMGITIHDVLSNGFWSAEQRGSYEYLMKTTGENVKRTDGKNPYKVLEDGTIEGMLIYTLKCPTITNNIRWKRKMWDHYILKKDGTSQYDDKVRLTANRNKTHKEKTLINERSDLIVTLDEGRRTNAVINGSTAYTVKPLKKDVRPMGPLVGDDWFPDSVEKTRNVVGLFYDTEENAVTNVISDNEAYITRTISQSGFIESYGYSAYPVNEDATLLRVYNTHITTDADHVYVDQTITENSTNNPFYNQQDTYQTQYTATFKKGQWKGSTETITYVTDQQAADWYLNYLKQKQTTQVSSHQPAHWTMNQRQNSR